jgi:Exocyst complex component Sec8 C-terminal
MPRERDELEEDRGEQKEEEELDEEEEIELRGALRRSLNAVPPAFLVPQHRFNPLPHAVQALSTTAFAHGSSEDPSSASSIAAAAAAAQKSSIDSGGEMLSPEDLRALFASMDAAAGEAVDAYAEGFGASIQNYSAILAHVGGAQGAARRLRRGLSRAQQYLADDGTDRATVSALAVKEEPSAAGAGFFDMEGASGDDMLSPERAVSAVSPQQTPADRRRVIEILWRQHLECEAMLDLYARIERVTQAPDQVAEHARRRHYLHAARVISRSVEDVFSEDLLGIRALSTLRRALLERKNALRDTILGEIVDFIYAPVPRKRRGGGGFFRASSGDSFSSDDDEPPGRRSGSFSDDDDDDDDEEDSSTMSEATASDAPVTSSSANAISSSHSSSSQRVARSELESLQAKVRPRSRNYLRILIESIAVLERTPLAAIVSALLSSIRPRVQQVSAELHSAAFKSLSLDSASRQTAFRADQESESGETLSRFFLAVFERCLDILGQHALAARLFARQLEDSAPRHESVACVFSVWSVMQQELERLVCTHLDFTDVHRLRDKSRKKGDPLVDTLTPTGGGSVSSSSSSHSSQGGPRSGRLFSFANSSAATFYAESITESQQQNTMVLVPGESGNPSILCVLFIHSHVSPFFLFFFFLFFSFLFLSLFSPLSFSVQCAAVLLHRAVVRRPRPLPD